MGRSKIKKKKFKLDRYIITALRKIWRWWPPRKEALIVASIMTTTKELFYICNKCTLVFSRKRVHVDHKHPVIDPKIGFETWDKYIKRLFVSENKLQILCKSCHRRKTNAENKKRKS